MEAISPTGPEAHGEDDLKAVKDDLLTKITKVDRDIAKTESQIAKLKKKYQEQEEHAKKPLSEDEGRFSEEDDKPKNQSIAQIIYAQNRVSLWLLKITCHHLFFVYRGKQSSPMRCSTNML